MLRVGKHRKMHSTRSQITKGIEMQLERVEQNVKRELKLCCKLKKRKRSYTSLAGLARAEPGQSDEGNLGKG